VLVRDNGTDVVFALLLLLLLLLVLVLEGL
jgi:hypothetical protein